jgi:hypothetical protein
MAQLVTARLNELSDAVTNTQPSLALGVIAFKGQKATDEVYLTDPFTNLVGPVSGTTTDQAPALAALATNDMAVLFLAWKVAGKDTVEVRKLFIAQNGVEMHTQDWLSLPTAPGQPSNPAASTDAAPAMAVANGLLYMVWKTPGADAPMAWSVYEGTGWSAPETIPSAKTSAAPALAGFITAISGNLLPLCLAYKGGTTDRVYWSLFTPGSSTLTQNVVPGAATDVAPAVTPGPALKSGEAYSYFVIWKPKGATSLSFVPVSGQTTGQTFTLPQVETNLAPAATNDWNFTSGNVFLFENLRVAFVDKKGNVWHGVWNVVLDPAPFPGGLEGNVSYVFYRSSDCKPLRRVMVSIGITQDLDCPQGFSIQLNANSPTNAKNYSRCNWQQCGLQVDSQGNLSSWVNNSTLNDGAASNTPAGSPNPYDLYKWPTAKIPAGSILTITLQYDHDLSVTSAAFCVIPANGEPRTNQIDYEKVLSSGFPQPGFSPADYVAPICAIQLVVVGFISGEDADFKSGAGTITVGAEDPLIAGDSRPSCSDVTFTVEQSNIVYGVVSATPNVSIQQPFFTSPKKN